MGLLDFLKRKEPARLCSNCGGEMSQTSVVTWECPICLSEVKETGSAQGPISITFATESGPRELITDRQRQFLIDLGEPSVPRFKRDASLRIDELVGVFNRWVSYFFSRASNLERPEQRQIQIVLSSGEFRKRFPEAPEAWSDEQRIEFLTVIKNTIGLDLFLTLGPKGITKFADALGIPGKQRKPKVIKFACACGQSYEAPEEMADASLKCQSCNTEMRIPRPQRGYYAAPTEAQLLQAELYEIAVSGATHRGKLKAQIASIQCDPLQRPSWEELQRRYEKQRSRRLTDIEEQVAQFEVNAAMAEIKPAEKKQVGELIRDLKRKRKQILDEIEEERISAEADAREEAREEKWFRRECYEPEFNRDGDWAELYHKPTRFQFDAAYTWLDEKYPNWSGIADLTRAINHLFPELKK